MDKHELSAGNAVFLGKMLGLALALVTIYAAEHPDQLNDVLDYCETVYETVYEKAVGMKDNIFGEANEQVIYEDEKVLAKIN
jgi:hypothetical protein